MSKGQSKLRFGDHTSFHRQLARGTIAGAALGLVGYLLATFWPLLEGFSLAHRFGPSGSDAGAAKLLWLAAAGAALALAARPPLPGRRLATLSFGFGLSLMGALVLRALVASPPVYPWFGVGIWGLALGVVVSRDLRDHRRYLVPIASALSTMLAVWVVQVLVSRLAITEYIPALFVAPLAGAAFGFLWGTALALRQVHLTVDPLQQRYDTLRTAVGGELKDLLERAMVAYGRIAEVLRDREDNGNSTDPQLSRGVGQLIARVLDLGERWDEVEKEASRSDAADLKERVQQLDDKVRVARDPVARKQYELARGALEAQLGHLRGIDLSRERVVARLHNYLATLERVNLAVVNHRGADTAQFSAQVAPILAELDGIGEEMELTSEAIHEAGSIVEGVEEEDEQDASALAEEAGEVEETAPEQSAARQPEGLVI